MKKSNVIRRRIVAIVVGATVSIGAMGVTGDGAGASEASDVNEVVVEVSSSPSVTEVTVAESEPAPVIQSAPKVASSPFRWGGFFSALRGVIRW